MFVFDIFILDCGTYHVILKQYNLYLGHTKQYYSSVIDGRACILHFAKKICSSQLLGKNLFLIGIHLDYQNSFLNKKEHSVDNQNLFSY